MIKFALVSYCSYYKFLQTTKGSTLGSSSAYYSVDSLPPEQLLADTGKSSEEDDDDIDITEGEFNEDNDDSDEDIDIEDDHDDENDDLSTNAAVKSVRRDKLSAFMLFAKKMKPKIIEANPGLDFASLSKKLRELWSGLPNSEKAIWKRKLSKMTGNSLGIEIGTIPQQHLHQQRSPTLVTDQMTNNSGLYKVTGTQPIDAAAHLKLLGEVFLKNIYSKFCIKMSNIRDCFV